MPELGKVCIDLTERLADLEAENRRLSSEVDELRVAAGRLAALAAMVVSSEDAIIGLTLDGVILTWDAGAEHLYQYPAKDAIGKSISVFSPPNVQDEIPLLLRRVALGERIEHYKTTMVKKNGDKANVQLAISLARDKAGNVVGALTIARDFSETSRASMPLRASQYAPNLIEVSLDCMVTIGPDGRITDVNRAAEEVTGVNREGLIGSDFSDYFTEPDRAREVYQLVFSGGTVPDYALAIRHRSGRITDVLYNATVYRDATGEVRGAFAAARDVTECKKAQEEVRPLHETLAQRAAELEATNKELVAFSYSVSHDLCAPLNSIDGFSRALVENFGKSLGPEATEYLDRIRGSSQLMAQLIDDMLRLSCITRTEMRRVPVDLSSIARTIADDLHGCEPERSVGFVIAPDLTAQGDPDLLRIVLQNLIHNSWKFTSKNAGGRIEIGAQDTDGERAFFVRDDGAGFDMRYVDRMFTAFQRLHLASEFPGTGIGLASVQRVIRRHGGKVWAEGKVGEGATIYFTVGDGKNTVDCEEDRE